MLQVECSVHASMQVLLISICHCCISSSLSHVYRCTCYVCTIRNILFHHNYFLQGIYTKVPTHALMCESISIDNNNTRLYKNFIKQHICANVKLNLRNNIIASYHLIVKALTNFSTSWYCVCNICLALSDSEPPSQSLCASR